MADEYDRPLGSGFDLERTELSASSNVGRGVGSNYRTICFQLGDERLGMVQDPVRRSASQQRRDIGVVAPCQYSCVFERFWKQILISKPADS